MNNRWPRLGRDLHNTKRAPDSRGNSNTEYELLSKNLVRKQISSAAEKREVKQGEGEEDREKWEHLPNYSPIPTLVNKLKIDERWIKLPSPVIWEDDIFVSSGETVHRISIDGSVLEKYKLPAEIVASPAISEDTLIVGTLDNSLHAIDITTGDEVWSMETQGSVFGSPIISNNKIYFGDIGGQIYEVSTTGEVIWSSSVDNGILTRAAIVDDILFFGGLGVGDTMGQDSRGGPFTTSRNYFYAVDKENGDVLWKNKEYGLITDPVITDECVCIATKLTIRGVEIEEGTEEWETSLDSGVAGSPAVDNGHLVVGCLDGGVHRLIGESGEKVWEFETDGSILSSPAISGTTGVIASEHDGVYIFDTETGDIIQYFELDDCHRSAPAFSKNGIAFQNSLFIQKRDSIHSSEDKSDDRQIGRATELREKAEKNPESLTEAEIDELTDILNNE